MEDLWAFNEEVVARAVHGATTPIISAVGHEIDTTITDLVADVRAATPSQAAELVSASAREMEDRLQAGLSRLRQAVSTACREGRARLALVEPTRLGAIVHRVVERRAQHVDALSVRVARAIQQDLRRRASDVASLRNRLTASHLRRLAARRRDALEASLVRLRVALERQANKGRRYSLLLDRLMSGQLRL